MAVRLLINWGCLGIYRRDCWGRGIEILRECCADGWVSKYEKELASIL